MQKKSSLRHHFRRNSWKLGSQNLLFHAHFWWNSKFSFLPVFTTPRGMFWTVVAQFGPPGTPRKSAFFQEKGQKRMKKWGEVTFMKEWMEALYVAVILALTDLRYLVSFPRYGRLKKKCWYKQICNGTYWLLLTGHFGPVFIRPSQWSITAVVCELPNWILMWSHNSGWCSSRVGDYSSRPQRLTLVPQYWG